MRPRQLDLPYDVQRSPEEVHVIHRQAEDLALPQWVEGAGQRRALIA
ncbi:hypothetical protein [Streptomyces sp. NPDC005141]